jgi:hypothetical protein
MAAASRALATIALAIAMSCSASTTVAPSTPTDVVPEVAWGAYTSPRAPRYQLIFEGTTDGRRIDEVRIIGATGTIVATAQTTLSADETLRLCGGTKTGSGLYGPSRATFSVDESVWNDAVRRPDALRVEVRLGNIWRDARPKHICAAQVD